MEKREINAWRRLVWPKLIYYFIIKLFIKMAPNNKEVLLEPVIKLNQV